MTIGIKFKQISILISGLLYPIMYLTLPMASGGVSLIAQIFAPITLTASILMMVIQKVMNVFSKNKTGKTILYFLFISLILMFTFLTFPYA